MTYTAHRDTQDTLQILDRADMDAEDCTDGELYKKFGLEEEYECNDLSCWRKYRPKLWAIFEAPRSSLAAKVSGHVLGIIKAQWLSGYNKGFPKICAMVVLQI